MRTLKVMTRYSPSSVSSTVRGWIHHYRDLQLAERIVFTAWSAAILATLLGLVGVSIYQGVASAPRSEECLVSMVSPIYSTVTGTQYRIVESSCGRYEINPAAAATRALQPVAPDSLALTGTPESGRAYILTFTGLGSGRTIVAAMSH